MGGRIEEAATEKRRVEEEMKADDVNNPKQEEEEEEETAVEEEVDAEFGEAERDNIYRCVQRARGHFMGVVVADSSLRITQVNGEFCDATGYSSAETVGRTCSFLQGPRTCARAVDRIRKALSAGDACRVVLVNYRKDGAPLRNLVTISPLRNALGAITGYVGVQMFVREDLATVAVPRQRLRPLKWTTDMPARAEAPHSDGSGDEDDDGGRSDGSEGSGGGGGGFAPAPRPPRLPHKEISFVAETSLPTDKGTYRTAAFRDSRTGRDIVCTIFGAVEGLERVPVRVHDACFTSEVLGSLKCDCREQLRFAMEYVRDSGPGLVVYMQSEGRGIGLANKIKVYAAQERGLDTVDANRALGFDDDLRQYDAVPVVLERLGVRSVRLITNNPRKVERLEALGVRVEGRIPTADGLGRNPHSARYLDTKRDRMRHELR